MRIFVEAMHWMSAALLELAVGLLFEELTFGGLVRLMLAQGSGGDRKPKGG